ncbi:MAG: hypothetical protein DYG98_06825 [Haliscomenobacteraceae bacterium CHB4]|nr:hypothetical protein [Haliscomenobacteraceae bacterium CHB4]
MCKTIFTRLAFLAFALAASLPLAAQQIQLEKLPFFTNGFVFKGNELWQATAASLLRRDAASGEILKKYELLSGADGYEGIALDAAGNLWLTLGRGGVARFNGADNWQVWNWQNTPALPEGFSFSGIGANLAAGEIWVSGWNSDFSVNTFFWFNGATWQEETGLAGHYLRKFLNGPQGEFILCASDTLLLRENGAWMSIPEPDEGLYNYVENPVFDSEGKLWVTSLHTKFYRYNDLNQTPQLITQNNQEVLDMLFDGNGNLLTATFEGGMGRWDGSSWEFLPSVAGTDLKTYMHDLELAPNGKLWIAQSVSAYTSMLTLWDNGAPVKNFYAGITEAIMMEHDGAGNMWFGGYGPVLTRQNLSDGSLNHFELFDYEDEFWIGSAKLITGPGDDIWLITSEGNVLQFDGAEWKLFDSPNIPETMLDMAVDGNGVLYFIGYSPPSFENELTIYDPAGDSWSTVDFSIFGSWSPYISELEVDESNNLWFSTDQGLGKRSSDGSLEIFPTPNSNQWSFNQMKVRTGPGGKVYIIEEDQFNSAGLYEFDIASSEWTGIPWPVSGFPQWLDLYYLRWLADPQGRIWVAYSPNGFGAYQYWYWEAGIWNAVTDSLPGSFYNLAYDGNGTVHFGFYEHIGRFKPSGRIEGLLRRDGDENCTVSAADTPLPGFLLMATNGNQQYLGLSRPDGQYRIYSGASEVTVNAVPPNDLWESCTPGGVAVTVNEDTPVQLDLMLRPLADCPALSVDLSTPFLRRCFNNIYTARICNNGTATAEDAYVDISLPAEMGISGAGLSFTEIAPQTYRFQLGDLAVGDCKVFPVTLHVSCENTALGQTLCVTAAVFPDTICAPPAAWNGATVLLDAACDGDSVRFSLKNTGTAATSTGLPYRLLRNLTTETSGNFSLQPGQTRTFSAPATGDTWRLMAAQEPGHPFLPYTPSLAVEGCTTGGGMFETGHVTAFANSSGSAFTERECQELIGSFDPNDKAASPKGAGENTHFIPPGTVLDYTIRFQNTGTDTAFTVIVRDTLDRVLDLSTFEPGASSHPYRLDIAGDALAFVFENILLPDSNINLAASQGYVSFRIRPRADIPLGSVVTNDAAIYFDFNEPVLTNTVWHVVHNDFWQTVSTQQPDYTARPQLLVFPNPAQNRFWVKTPAETGILEMYDLQGRLLQQIRVNGDAPVPVECGDHPAGLYTLRFISSGKAEVTGGKVLLRRE